MERFVREIYIYFIFISLYCSCQFVLCNTKILYKTNYYPTRKVNYILFYLAFSWSNLFYSTLSQYSFLLNILIFCLFYSFYSLLLNFIQFIQFYSTSFCSFQLYFQLFYSVLFYSTLSYSILFYYWQCC